MRTGVSGSWHLVMIGSALVVTACATAGGPAAAGHGGGDHAAGGQGAGGQAAGTPNAEQAWALLREGNARYASGHEQHLNASAARRAEVAQSQAPFAIILSCADSRVPVERVFDRGIGDLFVIRVAGNVSDTDEIGTIEYGAGHLHAPLVVVMGHTSCGAVKAVASGAQVHGSIPGLVDNIIPAVEWVKKNRPYLKGDQIIEAAIEANVWQSIDDLVSHSQEIRSLLQQGELKVVGAVYDIASGQVRWLGEHPYQDRLINSPSTAPGAQSNAHGSDHAAAPETVGHGVPKDAHEAPAATQTADGSDDAHEPGGH